MSEPLATFLVTVYTLVDDLYRAHFAAHKPVRPGPRPLLSDSEVLTLVLCAQWHGRSERQFLRYVDQHWRAYFPRLLSQSAFNRRTRDLTGALVQLTPLIAAALAAHEVHYQVLDTVPGPLARRCRGRRRRLFDDEAGFSRGGSDRDAYFGCQLLVTTVPNGPITGWTLGPASTEGRWLAEAFFCWRHTVTAQPSTPAQLPRSHRRGGGYVGYTGPVGPPDAAGTSGPQPIITDRGFAGRHWQAHWSHDYGAVVLTQRSYTGAPAPAARRQHSTWRQGIEPVNALLIGTFHLSFPAARTRHGLRVRLAAKLALFNVLVWLNQRLGRPAYAFAALCPF